MNFIVNDSRIKPNSKAPNHQSPIEMDLDLSQSLLRVNGLRYLEGDRCVDFCPADAEPSGMAVEVNRLAKPPSGINEARTNRLLEFDHPVQKGGPKSGGMIREHPPIVGQFLSWLKWVDGHIRLSDGKMRVLSKIFCGVFGVFSLLPVCWLTS